MDEVEHDDDLPSYKWETSHQVADAMIYAASVARAAADFLEQVATRAASHHNWLTDQADFHAEASKAIESIDTTTEEG